MEVIRKLDKEPTESQKIITAKMDSILAGSITESLMGILPNEGKNFTDYRGERLLKYDILTTPNKVPISADKVPIKRR